MTSNQITFVRKIIDYVQENDYLEKSLLSRQPFDQVHDEWILGVFEVQEAIIRELNKTIDKTNTGAESTIDKYKPNVAITP